MIKFFLIFLFLKIKISKTENVTLKEEIIEGKSSSEINLITLRLYPNEEYDFLKIKIESNSNELISVIANFNNSEDKSLDKPEFRFIGYSPLIYFFYNRKTFKDYQIGIISNLTDYKFKYKGVRSNNIELYDNSNFTINTLIDKTIRIKYISELENLKSNFIIISISSPSLSDFFITAKYKSKEIKVYQLFPYSKIIILSSSIVNYTKDESLTFTFTTPKNTNIKITSRVINITNTDESLTEFKPFESYFTILGGDLNIIKECFYLNETFYKLSSEYSISGYSLNGVKIYQVDNDYKIIDNNILTIKNESNYFNYNGTISDKFCIETISSSSLTGIHFQILDMKNISDNQNKINQLIRNIPLKFSLTKEQIIYYPYDKLYFRENQEYIVDINITKGEPIFCYAYCSWFPLNCHFDGYEIEEIGIKESFEYELEDNKLIIYNELVDSFDYTYLLLIYCPNEICEYTINSYGNEEKEYMKGSSENNYLKINKIIHQNLIDNYLIKIEDDTITDIFVVLYSILGNVDLIVKKEGIDIGDYNPLIHKEILHIKKSELNDLKGFYTISAKSSSIAEYSLYYYLTNKSLSYINYIDSGLMDEHFITFKEKSKEYILVNPYKSNKNDFLIIINSLNCQINITFNENSFSKKYNQIILKNTDPLYSKNEYPIKIELLSFDTGNKIEREKCIFYIGGFEINSNNPIKLNEGLNYVFELSEEINTLTFYHEFKMPSNDSERGNINLLFDKNSLGTLNIKATVQSKNNIDDYVGDKEFKKEKELILTDINSFNTLILYKHFLYYGCENDNCKFTLTISTNENLSNNKKILFEFEIIGENNSPYYLPEGEMFLDIIKTNHYQYYFTDLKSNSYGEIVFNFKNGNAKVIGRIIRKNETDEDSNWNNIIRLPIISDSIDRDDGTIEFDYYNQKIIFNEENTKDCNISGCQIFIGVLAENEKINYYYNNTNQDFLVDYSVFLRYDNEEVELELNEFVFGSLSVNEIENEMDYFFINILQDTKFIFVEFDSELCEIYVKKNNGKANKNNYDYIITSENKLLEVNVSLNDYVSFAVSNIDLKGYFGSYYYFKVILPYNNEYLIQKLETSRNEYCIIDNESKIKNKCLFIVPLFTHSFTNTNFLFYAYNENYPNDNNITFYINEIEQTTYESNNDKINLFSTKEEDKIKGNLAIYSKSNFEKDIYLLITISSEKSGRILLIQNNRGTGTSISLYPNSKQIFEIIGSVKVYIEPISLSIKMKGDYTYYTEFVALNGTGEINNEINIRNISNNIDENYLPSLGSVYTSSDDLKIYVLKNYNFIFYSNYHWRSKIENLDEFEFGRINYINYLENNNSTIKLFPMSFYTYNNDDEINDIQINFKLEPNDTKQILNDNLKIKAYIVGEEYILKRKLNLKTNISNYNYEEGDGYLNDTLSGFVIFTLENINSLNYNGRKVLLIELNNENYTHTNITVSIEKIRLNIKSENDSFIEINIPKIIGNYFKSKISKSKTNILKLEKKNTSDQSMKIQLSLTENYQIYYVEYDSNNKELNKKNLNLENLEKQFGKYIFQLNELNPSNSGIKLYLTCNNKLRNLDNGNEEYISIKYNSYNNNYVPNSELNNYTISNQNYSITNKNNNSYQISIYPITLNNETLKNVDYSLNLYLQSDFSNVNEINKLYSGKPKYLFTNYSYKNNNIIFIENIEDGNYYINAIGTINDDNDSESLVYSPSKISIPFSTKTSENDTNDDTSKNNDNENDIYIGKENKKSKKWIIPVVIITVIIFIVGVVLLIFKIKKFNNKRNNYSNIEGQITEEHKLNEKEKKVEIYEKPPTPIENKK